MKYIYTVVFGLLLHLCPNQLLAQEITISGQVTDRDTKEGMFLCNIFIQGTSVGVTTDIDGYYTLSFDPSVGDSIGVSSLGYNEVYKTFDKTLVTQEINFKMRSGALVMDEVKVIAGENPANEILRQIVKHKPNNDIDASDSYEAEMYTKVELDLDEIDEKMRNRKIFKKFQFVFDNVDSTSDERPFLPAYVAERMYDVYHLKGKERKDILKAQQVSGVRNNSVNDFINSFHEDYNVYGNWLTLLGKEFVSPFSNQGLAYYEYYIQDSTTLQGRWCYKLKFKPKRKQENTFQGTFWVDMDQYAVTMLNMRMSPGTNINLVERIIIYYEANVDEETQRWLRNKEKTIIDFRVRRPEKQEEQYSVIGRKTVCYKDYKINAVDDTRSVFVNVDPEDVDLNNLEQDTSYWSENRHENLSASEASVYAMIDSIQNVPVFKTYSDIINTLATGYKVLGPVEIGEYWDLWTSNEVEGFRLGMGLGTSVNFSKNLRIYGYLAYGFKDKRFKYWLQTQYVFNKQRRTEIGAEYMNDVSFEYKSTEDLASQSLFAGWLRRAVPQKLLHVKEAKAYYQHGFKKGVTTRFVLLHRYLAPYGAAASKLGGFNFRYLEDPSDPSQVDTTFTTAEMSFQLRFAYGEKQLTGNFSSISLGTKYPVVTLKYTLGVKGIVGSGYNYHRINLGVAQWFYVRPAGWIEYQLEAGKIFGTLPYLFLESHPGNEAYFYNQNAFNSMNSFEFVSDLYVGLRIEHHWDGFLLNRIPLLRKLNWRTVTAIRAVWGTLSAANKEANRLNHYDRSYKQFNPNQLEGPFYGSFDRGPYMEASVGIENIFKFIRVDALWRLNYLSNRYAQRFSVRLTLDFNF